MTEEIKDYIKWGENEACNIANTITDRLEEYIRTFINTELSGFKPKISETKQDFLERVIEKTKNLDIFIQTLINDTLPLELEKIQKEFNNVDLLSTSNSLKIRDLFTQIHNIIKNFYFEKIFDINNNYKINLLFLEIGITKSKNKLFKDFLLFYKDYHSIIIECIDKKILPQLKKLIKENCYSNE